MQAPAMHDRALSEPTKARILVGIIIIIFIVFIIIIIIIQEVVMAITTLTFRVTRILIIIRIFLLPAPILIVMSVPTVNQLVRCNSTTGTCESCVAEVTECLMS